MLHRLRKLTCSNGRKWRRRATFARSARLEPLESRIMMAADPLYIDTVDDGTVLAAPQLLSQPLFKPLPPSMTINTRDIDLALAAGMHHLQSVLDADNNDIPFFYVYALTKAQAQAYGDPSHGGRQQPAHMAFERHLTSNAAGRALYALLRAAEATGVAVDPHAASALTTTVLRSLHKPRNGIWSDASPDNQMITGLAADPRFYGSTQFDLNLIYNIGAGMRGALALATLNDDPDAVIPGYATSASDLFEVAVYNFRKYYVYGGGGVGGPRTYNWETFRAALGLEGGDRFSGSVQGDLVPNWSGIWQGWADPFFVYALVKHHEATGHQPSLDLAKELRDYAFYSRFPLDPQHVPFHQFTHMFEVVGAMNAFARLAYVTNDADMMNRVRVRYEALRGLGFNSTGWVPENYGIGSDTGEINNTGELIETALTFAQWGWTEYYADVERFTRGHLLPAQLLDISFIEANASPQNDGQRDPAGRMYGAFGFPAPYGPVPTLGPTHAGGYFSDITAGGVATLVEIRNAVYRNSGGVHQINLMFDVENEAVSFVGPYTGDGRATITVKTPGNVQLQLPAWADREAVSASLIAQNLQFTLLPDAVLVNDPVVGETFAVSMPLRTEWATDIVNTRAIAIQWRGDEVISMSRMSTPMAFFDDRSTWRYGAQNGDFQQDGDVDGDDFLAWQRSFGLAEPAADADLDGRVDDSDLSIWADHFGAESTDSTAAAEALLSAESAPSLARGAQFNAVRLHATSRSDVASKSEYALALRARDEALAADQFISMAAFRASRDSHPFAVTAPDAAQLQRSRLRSKWQATSQPDTVDQKDTYRIRENL